MESTLTVAMCANEGIRSQWGAEYDCLTPFEQAQLIAHTLVLLERMRWLNVGSGCYVWSDDAVRELAIEVSTHPSLSAYVSSTLNYSTTTGAIEYPPYAGQG